jgi:transposase-like protein
MAIEKNAKDKSEIVRHLPSACADETKAVEFVERLRWKGHPFCPHCGVVDDCRQMLARDGSRNKRWLWRCNACHKQFSVKVGTVMEDSRIQHRYWLTAFWLACSSKKGVSALQIKRLTGLSYKSALFLMHRIRFAMSSNHDAKPPLSGTVEADETYVGGKPRRPVRATLPHGRRPYTERTKNKTGVLAIVARGGELRPFQLEQRLGSREVQDLVRRHVDRGARLMTDEAPAYKKLGPEFAEHGTTVHSRFEYVRGDIHSNTVEGFFSLLKRGVYGTFHTVSRKHLHRYLCEFEFRYNTRRIDDGERTMLAIQAGDGKRLTYREQKEG